MRKLTSLENCPYCENDEFYKKQSVKGYVYCRERFDNEEADNTELFNSVEYGTEQKTIYCSACHKKIAVDDRA